MWLLLCSLTRMHKLIHHYRRQTKCHRDGSQYGTVLMVGMLGLHSWNSWRNFKKTHFFQDFFGKKKQIKHSTNLFLKSPWSIFLEKRTRKMLGKYVSQHTPRNVVWIYWRNKLDWHKVSYKHIQCDTVIANNTTEFWIKILLADCM